MVGVEDLDHYGTWRYVAAYGWCWGPRVPVGWAPYRFGHWCWEEPWGWTWIDDEPWGFAPCHYGRWVNVSDWGWLWVPGPVTVRPCYAPALVAFVGGRNWGVSLAIGGGAPVGWFPLGPREVWVPPYRVSPVYLRDVNFNIRNVNVYNINVAGVHYVNFRTPGAVTVAPERVFVNSDPINRYAVRVDPRALGAARVAGMAPAVVPHRESVLAHPSGLFGVRAAAPPVSIQNRSVVVRRTPPAPAVPFAVREKAFAAHPGRPLDPQTLSRLRARAPVRQEPVRAAMVPGSAPRLRPARPGLPAAQPIAGAARPVPRPESRRAAAPPVRSNTPRPEQRPPAARGTTPRPENQRAAAPPVRSNAPRPEQRPPAARRAAPHPENQRAAAPPPRYNAPERRPSSNQHAQAGHPAQARPEAQPSQQRPQGGQKKSKKDDHGKGGGQGHS